MIYLLANVYCVKHMEKEMYTESEIRRGGGEKKCMESVSMSVSGSVCLSI